MRTDTEKLDVAICIDRMHFVGILPMMRSLAANTSRPGDVFFHIAVGVGESAELTALLGGAFPAPAFGYEIREFACTPFLDDYVRAGKNFTYAAYTSSVMNFARFYLGEIYPELDKFAYLDVDLIVQGDVAELLAEATLEEHDLAAVPVATFGTWDGGLDSGSPHLAGFDPAAPVFNNGIYVSELSRWRKNLPKLEHWMKIHRQSMADFVFGTQSIMNLAFYRNLELLAPEWNVRPLGVFDDIPEATLRAGKILHWAGERKPWKEDGLYREYWLPYAPEWA
jgi:lipopolysaccharide biosynthesis glycosyltransferase